MRHTKRLHGSGLKSDFWILFVLRVTIPALLLFILSERSVGQEIPDGTQGEVLQREPGDTIIKDRNLKNWNKFDGPLTTLKIGVGFLLDFVAYAQDSVSKEQVDLAEAIKVRDFRVIASGRFKLKRDITWKAGIMFDGATNSWFLRETGIMV